MLSAHNFKAVLAVIVKLAGDTTLDGIINVPPLGSAGGMDRVCRKGSGGVGRFIAKASGLGGGRLEGEGRGGEGEEGVGRGGKGWEGGKGRGGGKGGVDF